MIGVQCKFWNHIFVMARTEYLFQEEVLTFLQYRIVAYINRCELIKFIRGERIATLS